MDLAALENVKLPDSTGVEHQLGDLWQDRPVVLVFLRHFGCLHCRDHAVQVGERYDEITALGADLVAVGTGDERYAAAFVRDEHVPYLVLVDDHADAARAASVERSSFIGLFHPRTWKATVETWRRGHRIHKAGKRVTQLGATFVLGPGNAVGYAHVDSTSTDHAPIDQVLDVLRSAR
jgi:peroxiredoxin